MPPPKLSSFFFCEYWGKQFPSNFRVRTSFAKNIHVWRLVPVWLESRFDLAILLGHLALWMEIRHQAACRVYCEFSFLCVCYSMFSSSGFLVHINLYPLHFVLYSHHFLPTYCVILPQECCLLLKVVRRTWNNHLHVIQHDSSWKRAEVCYATPTKTRAAWPSSDRSVRPRCPFWTLSSIGVATEWYGSWWDSNGRGGWVLVFRHNLETWGPNHTTLATQQTPLTSSGCISISGTSRTGGISGCSEIVGQFVCSLVPTAQRLAWIICLFLCNSL